MADFAAAVAFVLHNEGGFNDDPADSGGATNFGISLRFLREVPAERLRKYGIFAPCETLGVEHIRELTVDQARLIYRGEFWEMAPFENISVQRICNAVFDCCVLHGIVAGIKIMQRCFWAINGHPAETLDDGILGARTTEAVNLYHPDAIVIAFRAEHAGYCRMIAEIRPKDREFLDGWLKRCYTI